MISAFIMCFNLKKTIIHVHSFIQVNDRIWLRWHAVLSVSPLCLLAYPLVCLPFDGAWKLSAKVQVEMYYPNHNRYCCCCLPELTWTLLALLASSMSLLLNHVQLSLQKFKHPSNQQTLYDLYSASWCTWMKASSNITWYKGGKELNRKTNTIDVAPGWIKLRTIFKNCLICLKRISL